MTKLHQRKTVLGTERATTIDYTKAQGRERAVAINHKGTGPIMSSSGHPSGPLELTTHRQAHGGNEEEHTEYRVRSQCRYDVETESSVALALRGQGPSHSGATCVTHASPSVFGHPTISSSVMEKPIPAFG
jgi:hypothetical protein